MFVYQNNKLYVQNGDTLIGVEIYSDSVTKIKGTETPLSKSARFLTPFEVRCKFNLDSGGSYIFPQQKVPTVDVEVKEKVEEVVKDVATNKPKINTRKRK